MYAFLERSFKKQNDETGSLFRVQILTEKLCDYFLAAVFIPTHTINNSDEKSMVCLWYSHNLRQHPTALGIQYTLKLQRYTLE